MSILSKFVEGKISEGEALTETEAWFSNLGAEVTSDPAVQSAVTVLKADASAALNVAAEWAGTALDGALSVLAQDISTAVTKYGASIGFTGPLNAALITAAQAAIAVGTASVQHGVTAIQNPQP